MSPGQHILQATRLQQIYSNLLECTYYTLTPIILNGGMSHID